LDQLDEGGCSLAQSIPLTHLKDTGLYRVVIRHRILILPDLDHTRLEQSREQVAPVRPSVEPILNLTLGIHTTDGVIHRGVGAEDGVEQVILIQRRHHLTPEARLLDEGPIVVSSHILIALGAENLYRVLTRLSLDEVDGVNVEAPGQVGGVVHQADAVSLILLELPTVDGGEEAALALLLLAFLLLLPAWVTREP